MTDDDFKLKIKGTEYNDTFISRLANIENEGIPRADAFQKAKHYVTLLMSGEDSDAATSTNVDTFDPIKANYGASKDIRGDYLWVNDNAVGEPDWDSCPSNGARNLLIEIRRSPRSLARFYEVILPKILPSVPEQNRILKMEDDGRGLSKLTGQLQEEYIGATIEAKELSEASGLRWGDSDERA